ncbi:MAG: hypothetical protein M1839_000282 [Geoglossum umbratile]|nr:MAG: hypothetical protein M1839_000282 [Geoglossum umbratile]
MVRKTGGAGARGGKKGENRDIDRVKFGGRKFARGSNFSPLGQPGNAFASTSSGEMTPEQIYSLQDEARNTDRHRSGAWSSNTLRNQRITFVSAGHFDAKKLTELGVSDTAGTRDASGLAENTTDSITQLEDTLVKTGLHEDTQAMETDGLMGGYTEGADAPLHSLENAALVAQDSCGTTNTQPNPGEPGALTQADLTPSVAQPSSPTPSDSSQEVILFTGRDQDTNVANEQMARRPTSSDSTFGGLYCQDVDLKPGGDSGGVGSGETSSSEMLETPGHLLPPRRKMNLVRDREEEAIIADYIANMKEHGDMEGWQDYGSENEVSTTEAQTAASKHVVRGWNALDPHHLDVVSTSTNALGDIDSILAKRSRPNGDQFLVQFKGYSINEVRWIPRVSLATESQLKQITVFETAEGPEVSAYESEDSDNMDEDRRDEKKIRQGNVDTIADEKLARLFSKQDDLGLTSSELLGLGDTDETISDGYMFDAEGVIASLFSKPKKASSRKGHFPSATQVANAYDDFDIMDFERPSLNKGKGRKAALPFNLSDSELEGVISSKWENDRRKKAEKKKERAKLRAQGVLGKHNATNPDMRAKYEGGMTADDVEREIVRFLTSDREQLIFPCMDRPQRKMLHEISNHLHLKSKSAGSKKQRFTTLYKTSISTVDPAKIQRTFTDLRAHGFVWRMSAKDGVKKPKAAKPREPRPPRRDWTSDTTPRYRDGEIVGATAPELGTENKGRQMLEKMGWSSGTALGALNNKGILQPVATVIKTSKAGLG